MAPSKDKAAKGENNHQSSVLQEISLTDSIVERKIT
jgi:hypothetical protein